MGVACADHPVRLEIALIPPPGTSAGLVEVVARPYDALKLLDSLAAVAPDPQPVFPELELALAAFRRSAPQGLGEVGRAWEHARDSAQRLADSLRTGDRRSPGYRGAYDRFRQLYRRLADRSAAREAALRATTGEVRALALRAGAAADSVRAWERIAYAAFDSLAEATEAARAAVAQTAITDQAGHAGFELAAGAWWIAVRVPHPDNPFMEYTWDVPVLVRARWPLRVPLFEANRTVRWRH